MQKYTTHVGLDVHADTIWVAVARPDGENLSLGQIANRYASVSQLLKRLKRKYERLHFVYEAGPCGYDLYRQLNNEDSTCSVVAPSLIPRRPGDQVKTDRRDAVILARLSRSGDLVSVWVPDAHHEAVRELVRCREDVKQAERRARQRMCAMLLRHSRHYDKTNWTQEHLRWLRKQRFEHRESQATFEHILEMITETGQRLRVLDKQMEESLEDWSLASLVRGLMAMRGVKLLTAMILTAELGDITRFTSAQELMSYVGLVPSERSSGKTRRQGGITKSGNGHVRRVLVESAWHYRHRPDWSAALRARASHTTDRVRSIAWNAQKRLNRRYHRLTSKGKASQVAITAMAREHLGFVWAIGWAVMRPDEMWMTAQNN